MIQHRPGPQRGHADHGWLDTYHTFSFADYYDPAWERFRHLRVLNEDRIAPGAGFGLHPHRDMEILTYVVSGHLQHRDSLGHSAILGPTQVQRIRAGTGIRHSEWNPSLEVPVHLLQIWLEPRALGLPPDYAQREFLWSDEPSELRLLASSDGRDGALTIGQDADVYRLRLAAGSALPFPVRSGRQVWLQLVTGALTLNGGALGAGDGAAVSGESLNLRGVRTAEALLFDLG